MGCPTPNYTDAQILTEARAAMFALVSRKVSQATVGGDAYTLRNLTELQGIIDHYEARVEASAGYATLLAVPVRLRESGSGLRRRHR